MSNVEVKEKKATTQETMAFRNRIGSKLRELEKRLGKRETAANAAGVAKSTLQSWIEGRADPSLIGVVRLCRATGVSLDWLLADASAGIPLSLPAGAAITDEELMGTLVEGIVAIHHEEGIELLPAELGRLAARMAADIACCVQSVDQREIAIRMRLILLRRSMSQTTS